MTTINERVWNMVTEPMSIWWLVAFVAMWISLCIIFQFLPAAFSSVFIDMVETGALSESYTDPVGAPLYTLAYYLLEIFGFYIWISMGVEFYRWVHKTAFGAKK